MLLGELIIIPLDSVLTLVFTGRKQKHLVARSIYKYRGSSYLQSCSRRSYGRYTGRRSFNVRGSYNTGRIAHDVSLILER